MDFFNIPSELSKANSPAYKSGLLKLYAKGGFTGRSDYKRSIENDIRVGMYEPGGMQSDPPKSYMLPSRPSQLAPSAREIAGRNTQESTRTATQNFTPQQRATAIPRQSNVVGALDIASDVMRFGKYIPHPVAQAIGNAGTLLGNGIDMYQGINYLNQGNYKDAAANAIMSRVGKTSGLGAGFELAHDISNYEKGGLIAFDEGGKSGDPTDEELAAAQLRYNQMTPAYSKAKEAYEKELKRVSDIRSNVVSEADKINRADDQYRDAFITEDFSRYPKGYLEFINAKNPQELEAARKNLPEDVRNLLPNDGKYTVAQWNPQTNSWKKGAEPNRELYCTPYACFPYQKAGAKDVPIVSGNVGFEAMAKSGKLPFKKIDPTQREPGDVGLMVELAPADYINNQTLIRRPHHTGIYAQADIDDAENTEKGFFFNAIDGNRLMYDVSLLETNQDPKDRIDYYRYVGQTEKLKSELDKMEPERQRLQNFLSQAYKERTLPSRPINAIPNSMAPQPSQPIQLFGKGGYRVVRTSERKGKTHKVIGPGGKVKYFGDPSMGERSKSKYGKEAFYKRHAKNLKANPYFRAYARATWSEGGIVRDVEPFNLSSY